MTLMAQHFTLATGMGINPPLLVPYIQFYVSITITYKALTNIHLFRILF